MTSEAIFFYNFNATHFWNNKIRKYEIFHIQEIKHVFCAFIAWWKPRRTFGRIREQFSEKPRRSRGFSPAREFLQTLPRFSLGYEGTENMFYFFYKILIFRLNKEKDDMRSAYVYSNFFHETVTSHNLEIAPTTLLTPFSCFIALWKHTCRPIKMHTILSKLFYN